MELFSIRFTSYGLLLLCTFWSVTDCTTTTPSLSTDVTTGTSTVTTQPPTTSPPSKEVENVKNVTVVGQTENSVIIEFNKVENISTYNWYYGTENRTFKAEEDNPMKHTLDNLTSAQNYSMSLRSVSTDGRESTGYKFYGITAPKNVDSFKVRDQTARSITLEWTPLDGFKHSLEYDGNNVTFNSSVTMHVVRNLDSNKYYKFSLRTVFKDVKSTGLNLTAATAPPRAEGFKNVCENESSITLQWNNEVKDRINVLLYKLTYNETEMNLPASELGSPIATYPATGLQSATNYTFSLVTIFGNITGEEVTIIAPTAPRNTDSFTAVDQNKTSITLWWNPIPNITEYILLAHEEIPIKGKHEETITGLASATLYNFTLFAVFAGVRSRGFPLTAPTEPPPVTSVKVTKRTLNSITLQWDKGRDDWDYVVDINDESETVPTTGEIISYTAGSLTEGTLYPFSITTLFYGIESKAPYKESTVTTIDCSKVSWTVTETMISGRVDGRFTSATASNGTKPHNNNGPYPNINFTGLYPGATYNVTLKYDEWEQCNEPLKPFTTIPPALKAKCKNWNSGYSIYVEWDSPDGILDKVEVSVAGEVHIKDYKGENFIELPNFQPAQKYQVSICSRSREQKSTAYVFTCPTDARGVIAGAFFGVLLFLILACAIAFVLLRRPDIIRRNKPHLGGTKTPVVRSKAIPLEKFPAHFSALSADEYKGISLEYEDLGVVGTDQSQKAATTAENKPKNRFVNVLPYDRSRVKLTSSSPHNDYINASYMPGYNSDREFIAAQGPLPSTASDFWRMIWELKVKGIVMVTNCVEGGRTKCEQYWPDSGPRVCGDLAVFKTSENKESDWTLREFSVKSRRTSEERTVKHFHFTAWPDHGVPDGTEVLIRFRALVRKHIQIEAAGAPTVVHCSAGVGRTGTIIALDTLLQQMEKENAVDINGFVHKMRLNRPHMVQTESQYVFLHQCVLDSLRPNTTHEDEHIYENERDLIYANATALREYQNSMNKA